MCSSVVLCGSTDRKAARGWARYGPFFEAGSLSRFSKNARVQPVAATTLDDFMADPTRAGNVAPGAPIDVLKIDTARQKISAEHFLQQRK